MKQIFKSIAAFALVATLSVSCSKDESTPPSSTEVGAPTLTVVIPTADLNLRYNDIATIKFTAAPATGAKFKSLLITRKNLTSEITNKIYGDSVASLADSLTVTRTIKDSVLVSIGNVGDKFIYTIIVTDDKGKSTSKIVNLAIKDLYTSGQFTMGAQANTGATFQNKFFGLNENAPITIDFFKAGIATPPTSNPSTADSMTRARFYGNSNKIDFLFFFGTANGAGLYSPDYNFGVGQGWATEITSWLTPLNKTIFKTPSSVTLTQSEFAASNYNVELAIDAIDFNNVATNQNFVNNLQDQKVIAFKTAKGRGLILVVKAAINNTSFATFEVKWKKN
ncbi:MAG: hypothetical protein K9G64_06135 [Bacteroidia bacterium]|nr:hypothetical protein [Bacteroidia bacterium]